MAAENYDLFIIGAGSGGVRAARMAASYGARVAVAEERYLGGTCVNVGCIPKKLLVYASHCSYDFEDAEGLGWTVGARSFDWATFIARKDTEITRLNGVYARLLDESGVTRVEGRARLTDPHTVVIGDRRFTAEHILVATGSWPSVPKTTPGIEQAITSNEAFHLKALPRRVIVVGGGYIAVEFAGIFNGQGAHVTQLYRGSMILRGFDDDVRSVLAEEMRKRGIDLRLGTDVTKIERAGAGVRVALTDGSTLEADVILYATGRLPLTADLGLEAAGVQLDKVGAVVVDEYSRSTVPSVWAVGDVTNRINLTPVAIHEAMAFAHTAFGGKPTKPDHEDVASCVFSQPSIGCVGLTETAARARYGKVDVYRSRFRPLKHTVTGRDETTLMKLIVDCASDRVVGCHMIGADAGEIIQGFAVALKCGATKAQFDATVGIHPTAAEEFVTMRTPIPG